MTTTMSDQSATPLSGRKSSYYLQLHLYIYSILIIIITWSLAGVGFVRLLTIAIYFSFCLFVSSAVHFAPYLTGLSSMMLI